MRINIKSKKENLKMKIEDNKELIKCEKICRKEHIQLEMEFKQGNFNEENIFYKKHSK